MPASSWIHPWSSESHKTFGTDTTHLYGVSLGPYSCLKFCQLRLTFSSLPLLKLNYLLRQTDGTLITYAVLGFLCSTTVHREQNTKKYVLIGQKERITLAHWVLPRRWVEWDRQDAWMRQDAVEEFLRQPEVPKGQVTRGAAGQESFAYLCWRGSE